MNKEQIQKLRDERAKIVADQRALVDAADKESRSLTADENINYENMDKRFNELTDSIKAAEEEEKRHVERLAELAKREEHLKSSRVEPTKLDPETRDEKRSAESRLVVPERYRDAFAARRELTKGMYATPEYEQAFRNALVNGTKEVRESRALQADADTMGGFLVAPEQFIARLIQKKDDMVFVRRMGTVIPVLNATSLGAPALDNDPGDPTWTAEIRTGSEDSTMDFDKRELKPHPLARRIKVSKKLIRVSTLSAESVVRDRLGYKFAVVEENAFLNGNGANQPLGVFTASAHGINTDRDVSTGNAQTNVTADGLIEAKYHLKAQYRNAPTVAWAFHRDGIKRIRKLKDGNGDYLWKMGITSDRPDTILDIPFFESEYCPNTWTSTQRVGIIGDWSYYWIADALSMEIQVVTELYAETGQNGYIGRQECDGLPVLSEAFIRVTLA